MDWDGVERRTKNPDCMLHSEMISELTNDIKWIKDGIKWGLSTLGAIVVVSIGIISTYTISIHNSIDVLNKDVGIIQQEFLHNKKLWNQHHNQCHFVVINKKIESVFNK